MALSAAARRRLTVLLCRAATALCSGAGLVVFVILFNLFNGRSHPSPKQEKTARALKYLPVVGLAFSAFWNLFSMVTYGMRSARWFPRRFKLYSDFFGAIGLAALGYSSFVYDVLTDWRVAGSVPMSEKRVELIAMSLLSISGAAHLVFFCCGCTGDLEDSQNGSPKPLKEWPNDQLQLVKSLESESGHDGASLRTSQSNTMGYRLSSLNSDIHAPTAIAPFLTRSHQPTPPLPVPVTQPLQPVHEIWPTSAIDPDHVDRVDYANDWPSYSPTHHRSNSREQPQREWYDEVWTSPRPAPALPADRRRPPMFMEQQQLDRGFPQFVDEVSPVSSDAPSRTWTISPPTPLSPITPPSARLHGRSASSVSRLRSLSNRSAGPHRRAQSTPDTAATSPAEEIPGYLPGGYITNLEQGSSSKSPFQPRSNFTVLSPSNVKDLYG